MNTSSLFKLVHAFVLLVFVPLFLCGWEAEGAPEYAQVKEFPGFDGSLPSKHFAGYITVGNQPNMRHLYYYFATSERNPAEDAVLLWVNGGPGCSGLDAMVHQHGPFKIIDDFAPRRPVKLLSNPFSWTKAASIIYVDSPAGTGYSYADSVDDYITNDTKTVADLYEFILKFFSEYPEFLPNPLYLGACSYSGVVVPVLAQEMVNGIEAGKKPDLNFKGYSMGNAAIDINIENNGKIPFAHRMGLISDEIYEDLTSSCKGDYWRNSDADCLKNLKVFQEVYNTRQKSLFDMETTRETLHAVQIEVSGEWIRCTNPKLQYERDHFNLIPYHLNLTMKGYRSFIYCGDHDMVVPYTATAEWIKSLNYSVIEGWRPWFVDGLIAGYNVRYDHNLLFATFKGAGHTVPQYVPHQAFIGYQRWIDGAGSL